MWIKCHILARRNAENRLIIPVQNTVINPSQPSPNANNDHCPPPPYSAEPLRNFEESLPSYEKATGRS